MSHATIPEPAEALGEPFTPPAKSAANPDEPAAAMTAADGFLLDYFCVPTPVWLPEPINVENSTAATPEQMKPYTEVIGETGVTFDMVPIPGGTFLMGSPNGELGRRDDEGPQVEIEIGPFWMGKHEVTWNEYDLWANVLEIVRRRMADVEPTERHKLYDALAFPTKPFTDLTFGMGRDDYPALGMAQTAAKIYCKWLSAQTGRYYRLPTEAEWEYAARAGSETAYSFGDAPESLGDYAWFFGNTNDRYQKVGQKKPNPWDLHDMHGNVAEWVLDQHVPDFYATLKEQPEPVKNPLAEAIRIFPRVVRGGAWDDDPEELRSAARRGSTPDWMESFEDPIWYHSHAYFVGFRVVRPFRVPTPAEARRYELDEAEIAGLEEYRKGKNAELEKYREPQPN